MLNLHPLTVHHHTTTDSQQSRPPEPGTKAYPLHHLCLASQLANLGTQPTKQVIHASTP
jgi:hypothetical protein